MRLASSRLLAAIAALLLFLPLLTSGVLAEPHGRPIERGRTVETHDAPTERGFEHRSGVDARERASGREFIAGGDHAAERDALNRPSDHALAREPGRGEFSADGREVRSLNPHDIRFSQKTVSGEKVREEGNYRYEDIRESMRRDGWVGAPIDVVRMRDGKLTSIDNTRLKAAQETGTNVEANEHGYREALSTGESRRFSDRKSGFEPKTWGEAIDGRIDRQGSTFAQKNPHGTESSPRVTEPK